MEVDFAARPDVHRGNPSEAERRHIVPEPLPLGADAVPSATRALAYPLGFALIGCLARQLHIDCFVGQARRYRYRPADAVTSRSFVPSRRAPAVVVDVSHVILAISKNDD